MRSISSRTLSLPALAITALFFLSGCLGASLNGIADANPAGPQINQALRTGYIDLARAALAKSNFRDSDFYASKARLAARGAAISPEPIANRAVPPARLDALNIGRTRLVVALAETRRVKSPRLAARALTLFDCWIIAEDIRNSATGDPGCGEKFSVALTELRIALNNKQ